MKQTVQGRDRGSRPKRRENQQPNGDPREQRQIVIREGERKGQTAREREQHARIPGKIHFRGDIQRLMIALKPAWSSAVLADSAVSRPDRGRPARGRNCRWKASPRTTENFFLLQGVGHSQRVAFVRQGRDLQHHRTFDHSRAPESDADPELSLRFPPAAGGAEFPVGRRGVGAAVGAAAGVPELSSRLQVVCCSSWSRNPIRCLPVGVVAGALWKRRLRAFARSGERKALSGASAACTGPAVLVVAHHVAEREENTAQQHDAQK